jgi:hypothetical protein
MKVHRCADDPEEQWLCHMAPDERYVMLYNMRVLCAGIHLIPRWQLAIRPQAGRNDRHDQRAHGTSPSAVEAVSSKHEQLAHHQDCQRAKRTVAPEPRAAQEHPRETANDQACHHIDGPMRYIHGHGLARWHGQADAERIACTQIAHSRTVTQVTGAMSGITKGGTTKSGAGGLTAAAHL